ncbi:hypothetical protein [Smaragdicoccus niigatensis]|uniref:hypothetical protein n=1 Tax=Smaragdicoccus niigatensis TaxID=359359 RepID=UPI00076714FB|nr:hypothetical protein [Smaragdicoccus niigatensis]
MNLREVNQLRRTEAGRICRLQVADVRASLVPVTWIACENSAFVLLVGAVLFTAAAVFLAGCAVLVLADESRWLVLGFGLMVAAAALGCWLAAIPRLRGFLPSIDLDELGLTVELHPSRRRTYAWSELGTFKPKTRWIPAGEYNPGVKIRYVECLTRRPGKREYLEIPSGFGDPEPLATILNAYRTTYGLPHREL